MDFISDVPLILVSIAIIFVGQAFWSNRYRNKRAILAIQQRDLYFSKLSTDSMKMIDEVATRVDKLEQEKNENIAKLRELDLNVNLHNICDEDEQNPEELKKTIASLKQKRSQSRKILQSIEDEIAELCQDMGLDQDDDEMLNNLQKSIQNLEVENANLEVHLKSHKQPTLSIREDEMDPELTEYLTYDMNELEDIYKTLIEIRNSDPSNTLDEYRRKLERPRSDYQSKLVNLDSRRNLVEKRLRQTQRLYQEELSSFNESRIEYLFKNTGAQELLKELREKNSIAERIMENRRRETESRKREPGAWIEYQDNQDL